MCGALRFTTLIISLFIIRKTYAASAPTTVIWDGKAIEVTFIRGPDDVPGISASTTDDFGKPLPNLGPSVCSSLDGPGCSFMDPLNINDIVGFDTVIEDIIDLMLNQLSAEKEEGEEETEDGSEDETATESEEDINTSETVKPPPQDGLAQTLSDRVKAHEPGATVMAGSTGSGTGTTAEGTQITGSSHTQRSDALKVPSGFGKLYRRTKTAKEAEEDNSDSLQMKDYAKNHNIPSEIAQYFQNFAETIQDGTIEYQAFIMETDAENEELVDQIVKELMDDDSEGEDGQTKGRLKTFVMDVDGVREIEGDENEKYVSVEKFLKDAFGAGERNNVDVLEIHESKDVSTQQDDGDVEEYGTERSDDMDEYDGVIHQ